MAVQLVETIVIILKIIFLTVIGTVKAILPVGVLPRKDVKGQIVLITGSGSGLGKLMALEFAKLNARLVLWDINERGNQETLEQVVALGAEGHAYTLNLANKDEIYSAAERVKSEVGAVEILINNAGVVSGRKLVDCSDEQIELTMAVNCMALLFTGKAFIPKMLENNHGHVVTIASILGKMGAAGVVDYCTSKHGAVGFHESLTAEINSIKKTGVHTTVVCPIGINTGMFEGVTITTKLLPMLEPTFVVERVMEAILTNQRTVCITRLCYVALFLQSFLPSSVIELMAEYLELNEAMSTFTGRTKKSN